MTKHTKQAIIISVIILLVLCAGATIFAFRTDLQCLWWYVQCRTLEKDNEEYKFEVVDKLEKAKSIRILCWMLKDKDNEVRLFASTALDNLGDNRAMESLRVALQDKDGSVRSSALVALYNLGDKRAVYFLIEALKDKYTAVRCNAAGALGELGDKRAIEPLKKALTVEKNELARGTIQSALKKLESLPDTP